MDQGDVILEDPPSVMQRQNGMRCVTEQCVGCKVGEVCKDLQLLYKRHWHRLSVIQGSWRIPWIEKEGKCTSFSPLAKGVSRVRQDGKEPMLWQA